MLRVTPVLVPIALLAAAPLAQAAPSGAPVAEPAPAAASPIVRVTPDAERAPVERPTYGPIRAKDPAVRAQIKHLYLEMNRVDAESHAEVAALGEQLRAERDPDFRRELQQEVSETKRAARVRRMELGLEIARLNGDDHRVAEFELALDQVQHPEKYRPAPADPAIERARIERMRELEQEGAGR